MAPEKPSARWARRRCAMPRLTLDAFRGSTGGGDWAATAALRFCATAAALEFASLLLPVEDEHLLMPSTAAMISAMTIPVVQPSLLDAGAFVGVGGFTMTATTYR